MSSIQIDIRDLGKRFGATQVLKDVSLQIDKGEVLCIIGPSGSGKSTLLRCINFLEDFQEGSIYVDGNPVGYRIDSAGARIPVGERAVTAMRQQVGMVFQSFNLFAHCTALQNVALGPLKVKGMNRTDANALAGKYLAKVGLAARADHLPSQLSGGQQQRVAIARALAMQPRVLLLDEITSALDPELVGEVLDVVKQLAQEGMTMVLVTHEMSFAQQVADRVAFMDSGELLEIGPPKHIFVDSSSQRIQDFLKRHRRD